MTPSQKKSSASHLIKHKTITYSISIFTLLTLSFAFFAINDFALVSLYLSIATTVYITIWTQEDSLEVNRKTICLLLSFPIAITISSLLFLFYTFRLLEQTPIPQTHLG